MELKVGRQRQLAMNMPPKLSASFATRKVDADEPLLANTIKIDDRGKKTSAESGHGVSGDCPRWLRTWGTVSQTCAANALRLESPLGLRERTRIGSAKVDGH